MAILSLRLVVALGSLALIKPDYPLQTLFAFSVLGYLVVELLIPRLSESFIRVGLKGTDVLKVNRPVLPETMGLVAAVTYLFAMFFLIPFVFFKYLVLFSDEKIEKTYTSQYESQPHTKLFPHNKLAEYLSAVLCVQLTILLGLFDDLFDIRWRHKFFLPAVASLPLLIVYYVDFSVTQVMVPPFIYKFPYGEVAIDLLEKAINLGNWIVRVVTGLGFTSGTPYTSEKPSLIDLGVFYYFYMSAVSIFSPNSINILAGINGLEVGQSVVLAVVFLVNDFCYLLTPNITQAAYDSHLFSAIFVIPFLGVLCALLKHNWFPARCFVGDTYCYFSGMVFAIVGIVGHFLKTLLIFLLPQIINFIYSVPQLFHIVPCPRHRMPKFNPEDGFLYPSFGELETPSRLISIMAKLKLVRVEQIETKEGATITRFSNLTLINLSLVWLGPMREDRLCLVILAGQLVTGMTMIAVRHTVGPWMFGYDNLSWGVK